MYFSSDGFTNRLMMVLTTYFFTADFRRSMVTRVTTLTPRAHPRTHVGQTLPTHPK